MTNIFVWAELSIPVAPSENESELYIGLALTDQGRWLAGAVSRESAETVTARVAAMALAKSKVLLSDPEVTVVETTRDNPLVLEALEKAFERMP